MVMLSLDEDAAASCSLDDSAESGEDNLSNMDPKPPKFRKRCRRVQRTFPFSSNQSSFDQYILSADHKHVFVHSQEGIPVAHSINHMKNPQSKYIHDEFFKSPIVRSGNVILIPSAQCMHDSIDDIVRRIGLREISFSFNPVEQDFSTSHIRSMSARTAEIARTPAICCQLQVDTKLAINLRKQDSEAKGCHAMTVSSSYLSTSSAHRSVTSAIVYCVWENKLPYFLFIVDDDGGEIFVANAMKVKSSADQTFDYIYVFHAWEVSRKVSKKDVTSSPHVVAKMTVSNSLVVSSNRSKFMETEFVLFDAKEEHLAGKDKPLSNCNKTNRLTKKVSEIFRPRSLLKHNPKPKDYELDSQFEVPMQTIDESQFLDHYTNSFLPIFELAATVVRDHGYKSSKEEPCGGWGLKFLQKPPNAPAQVFPSDRPESCRNDTVKNSKSLTVLVPAGVHGGPATKAGGPSSLPDRWKSNGLCGCGGWDVGCPLKVLQNDSADLGGEDCKSLELLIKGGKQLGEPSFKVVNMSKGVHVVNFESTLSALQSFSVAVAFFHSQAPELRPTISF
ncbi:uncharacterized protein LOC141814213 [Curcuma longa]|uniref:uncharacterized protein LOC141814213 n=1 Tax=Curcuma longa TaxID=136217 RepID=UPI003D9EE90E